MSRDRADEIFLSVCDAPVEERRRLLDDFCGEDAELKAEVLRLLRHDDPDAEWLAGADLKGILGAVTNGGPPDRVGGFRIIETIGTGGMGTVYLAEQETPRRRVALKMIRSGIVTGGLRKRFRAETELLGRLQHPGIAQIHEAGETAPEDGSRPWFAMEYVEGRELRDYAGREELGTRDRLALMARVADAVHHAHTRGVVHRDLKPENILVVPDAGPGPGQPKVLDFGVARALESDVQMTTMHTTAGEILGTLNYMSPEQISGRHDEVDGRSDVYALGVILHELLAGHPPCDLRGKSVVEAALTIERETPRPLGTLHSRFRGDVETIVGKALDKEIGRRYATAAELAADLRRFLADEPILARPPSARYRLRRFARRNRGLVRGLTTAFVVLIAGVVVSASLAILARQQTRRAEAREAESRRATYRFSLAAAEAVCDTDPRRALGHLAEAPEEMRGFEWHLLEARCRPCLARLEGTRDYRNSAALARDDDGGLVAALVRGESVEVVRVASGEVLGRTPGPSEGGVVTLSPDGSRIAVWSAGDDRIVIRSVADGVVLLERPVALAEFAGPCFSPNGDRLAIPLRGKVVLVEVETGREVFSHETLPDVQALAFDPRDGHLVVASSDRRSDGDPVRVDALGPDGKPTAMAVHGPQCNSLAVGPDGRIAFGARRRVHLLDGKTLELLSTPVWTARRVKALAFSPDGRILAAGSRDRTLHCLELETGIRRTLLSATTPSAIAFSGDGGHLAAGTTGKIQVWETEPSANRVLRGHETYVYQVAFSPDGARLASSDHGDHVLVRDRWSGEIVGRGKSNRAWAFLAFVRDDADLLVGRAKDVARHDPVTWMEKACVSWKELAASTVADRPWAMDAGFGRWHRGRDGRFRVRYKTDGPVEVHRDGAPILEVDAGVLATGVALSPDRAFLLTGHADGTIRRWSLADGAERGRADGHVGQVYAIVYSPDGTRVATGGEDGLVLIRDPESLEVLLQLGGHRSYVHGLAFSPDGRALASASGDGTVRLWESTPPSERPSAGAN